MKIKRCLSAFSQALCLMAVVGFHTPEAVAQNISIPGPDGSGRFGEKVYTLPNGNFVVVDHQYSAPGPVNQVGAVYLYDSNATLISALTGSSENDRVGFDGVKVLANGNFVVRSTLWSNGATQFAGAYTWVDGTTGLSGVVSDQNSLVGGSTTDFFGSEVVALSNGDYIIRAQGWDAGAASDVGAVVWADGQNGVAGEVSGMNALSGSTTNDRIGSGPIVELSNGHYLVLSPNWNHGAATRAGAVTWVESGGVLSDVVSAQNSLVGSTTDDFVGDKGITELANGHFVVASGNWSNGSASRAGAVTWGSGTAGITGEVTAANSLVGSSALDQVGAEQILALANGNYVVRSRFWDDGANANVGAVTWGNGQTGTTGEVSALNSLVGSTADDRIGQELYEVGAGNYVVRSPFWQDGPLVSVGAATWGNGATGISGPVSSSNSLVGSQAGDGVGGHVDVLVNGNYVVRSGNWDNGAAENAGAATWGNGNQGITGPVSTSNSLVGGATNDRVGDHRVAALSNGHYVVPVPNWRNGASLQAGAATWADGTTGIAGLVSSDNSLVGSQTQDRVGLPVTALSNGNYVVSSQQWDDGAVGNVGAVTWADGNSGLTGEVSALNSLIGGTAGDFVGNVLPLSNGNYLVVSGGWNSGTVVDAGAVTWANGTSGLVGEVSVANSLAGSTSGDFGSSTSIIELSFGDYVIGNPSWSNGALTSAGAVTWGSGTSGISGLISAENSLVGSSVNDKVGLGEIRALPDGNYAVSSVEWNNGSIAQAGARTLANADGSTVGPVGPDNSIGGTSAGVGWSLVIGYDPAIPQLIVGRPFDNTVNLLRIDNDALFSDGFE